MKQLFWSFCVPQTVNTSLWKYKSLWWPIPCPIQIPTLGEENKAEKPIPRIIIILLTTSNAICKMNCNKYQFINYSKENNCRCITCERVGRGFCCCGLGGGVWREEVLISMPVKHKRVKRRGIGVGGAMDQIPTRISMKMAMIESQYTILSCSFIKFRMAKRAAYLFSVSLSLFYYVALTTII